MKTIEERAEDVCDNIPYNVYIHSSVNCEDAFKDGYITGATEQKAIDDKECETMVGAAVKEAKRVFLDKVCRIVFDYLSPFDYDGMDDIAQPTAADVVTLIRKAMEE